MKFKSFDIRIKEKLGRVEECPYLTRWCFITPLFSIRLHKWLGPDDDRHFHNHPWNFIIFVLKGSYLDITKNGVQYMKRFSLTYRSYKHSHTVEPLDKPTWTLILTGPKINNWGFWVGNKLVRPLKYFYKKGHHPCN